jgi:phosphoribosylamine-glycine ligase
MKTTPRDQLMLELNVRMGDDEAEQLLDLAAELEERMRKLLLELYGNEELIATVEESVKHYGSTKKALLALEQDETEPTERVET